MPEKTLGITSLHEITGLKNPIPDPLYISEGEFPLSSDFYVRTHRRKFYARK